MAAIGQGAVAPQEESVAEEETRFEVTAAEPHAEDGPAEGDASEENENAGKVRWFSSFRRRMKGKQTEEADESAANTLVQGTAETIPFPRTHVPVEQKATETIEERRTLDAARQAVRSVFSGLGHGRSAALSEDGDESAAPGPAKARLQNGWAERLAESPDRFKGTSDAVVDRNVFQADRIHSENAQGEHPFNAVVSDAWLAEKNDGASGDSDPDAALREAMRAHFQSPANRTHVAPAFPDEELAETLETHLKSTAPGVTEEQARPRGIAGLWGKASPGFDENVLEPEPAAVEEPTDVTNDESAFDHHLYREIEETQENSGGVARRRRRGGLALAAAWGLFLCLASGLIVGFFAFRDIVADAAPGLAPLYRTLGMPVTVQPLVFESVQYEWSTSDNRPVLTVSGSVFNRAHRKVRVPQFFITIKDQDSALDREYSANLKINGSKIRSNERADFDIELVSPNPSVTAVELELRNVR